VGVIMGFFHTFRGQAGFLGLRVALGKTYPFGCGSAALWSIETYSTGQALSLQRLGHNSSRPRRRALYLGWCRAGIQLSQIMVQISQQGNFFI